MRLRSGGAYAAAAEPRPKRQNDAAALPHDVLVRIFSLLPRGALAVTPGRVNRAWAAAKQQAWAEWVAMRPSLVRRHIFDESQCPFLPLWYARSIYGSATKNQKLAIVNGACFHGQLDVMAELYAVDHGSFGLGACNAAAGGGQLSALQQLRQWRCPWNSGVGSIAAYEGHLQLLEWARAHGCTVDASACESAALKGDLQLLQTLRERGYPMDATAGCAAAQGGHVQVVAWLREHGQPLTAAMCESAAFGGRLPALQYLVAHGSPINVKKCMLAAREHPECAAWLETLMESRAPV
jgi:hypothetical protein